MTLAIQLSVIFLIYRMAIQPYSQTGSSFPADHRSYRRCRHLVPRQELPVFVQYSALAVGQMFPLRMVLVFRT